MSSSLERRCWNDVVGRTSILHLRGCLKGQHCSTRALPNPCLERWVLSKIFNSWLMAMFLQLSNKEWVPWRTLDCSSSSLSHQLWKTFNYRAECSWTSSPTRWSHSPFCFFLGRICCFCSLSGTEQLSLVFGELLYWPVGWSIPCPYWTYPPKPLSTLFRLTLLFRLSSYFIILICKSLTK